MGLIFELIFTVIGFYVLVTALGMISLVINVRRNLKNPFVQQRREDLSGASDGKVIEGEYKVLDEDRK